MSERSNSQSGSAVEVIYVTGALDSPQIDKQHTSVRFARRVRGTATEISVVTARGAIGVYGILPRLVTGAEAAKLYNARAVIQNWSVGRDHRGRLVQVIGMEVPSEIAKFLEETMYVPPYGDAHAVARRTSA